MEIADVQKFLADNHCGVPVARKRDGWPQITLVTPGIDGAGRVIITSRGSTYKVRNLRNDPRVSMLVMGEQFSGSKYVQLQGARRLLRYPKRWIFSLTGTGVSEESIRTGKNTAKK